MNQHVVMKPVLAVLASAMLVIGCRDSTDPGTGCVNPAPLVGQPDSRAPGYIVQLRDGVAVRAEVDRLTAKYEFTPTQVYESAIRGFAAELTPAKLTGVRCESSVLIVEHDGADEPSGPGLAAR